MELLKERIRREGKVLPGNIIKVDGFLNHRVDTALMSQLADEFAKYFDVKDITMVLTAEASGIPLATVCAQKYGVPMVFAKKAKSDNIEGGLYQSEIFSYTYKKKVTLIVAQEWLGPKDRVLIIDDFMPRAMAMAGLTTSSRPPGLSWWALAWQWRRASSTAATPCGRRAIPSTPWPSSRKRPPTTSPSGRMIPYEKGFSAGFRRPVQPAGGPPRP